MTGPLSTDDAATAWAASGAMALTGRPDQPALGPPAPLVAELRRMGQLLRATSRAIGTTVDLDPLQLLGERAAISGLTRRGTTSCGGATRLVPTASDWVAVCLARPDDLDLVPAWLERDTGEDPWATIEIAARETTADELATRACLLGLPVSTLPSTVPSAPSTTSPLAQLPCRARRLGDVPPTRDVSAIVVVDLSSLWAGPLCGSLLGAAGATVWKVEAVSRPDGARLGPPAFFDLLNADKRSVAVDFRTEAGRDRLRQLIRSADVVIEASRPRALTQLGVDAVDVVRGARPRVWVSITGHGRTGPSADRVGFGDDAAVAGGLVAWDAGGPCFCADAVADPTTGLVAAAACLDALEAGGRWLLDVSMAGVAASLAGPTLPVPATLEPAAPVARPVRASAAELGADDAAAEDWLTRT